MSHPPLSGASSSDHHDDAMHVHEGSLRSYLTGFVLAAILTVIPFWLVMNQVIDNRAAAILTVIPFWLVMNQVIDNRAAAIAVVLILAVAQIVVHIVYFLHLDTRSEGGWNMLAFIFSTVLVVIVLGASIWVLYHENMNMMPGMMPATSQQPHTMPMTMPSS